MQTPCKCIKPALLSLCLLIVACGQKIPPLNAGKLVVVVPESAQGPDAPLERELAHLFADQLHVDLEMVALPPDQALKALRHHQAHLAALPLPIDDHPDAIQYGPSYQNVRELLVCNKGRYPIGGLAGLSAKKLVVAAGSASEAALKKAQRNLPSLRWQEDKNLATQDLLAEVAEGTLYCVVTDELQFEAARTYYPDLVSALDIAPPSRVAWGLPGDVDPYLLTQLRIFFDNIQRDGTLKHILDRYYGHTTKLHNMDTAAFIAGINSILPHFRSMFEEASLLTGQDWRLLAALAYQESQWNPLATSFTNVRGMMMLTEETADQMDVSNRLDAHESILAGAQYLQDLKDQLPDHIAEPDRTWMALAAYNQGSSHLEDARILTERNGLNPDSWSDVKKWMQKLSIPEYYGTVKHGYARGGEAVNMVESVRSYYQILNRLLPSEPAIVRRESPYQLSEPMESILP